MVQLRTAFYSGLSLKVKSSPIDLPTFWLTSTVSPTLIIPSTINGPDPGPSCVCGMEPPEAPWHGQFLQLWVLWQM